MRKVGALEAKAHLAALLDAVSAGASRVLQAVPR
jgi:antitoxin (DNA-binding transcriptional repressor) of toxin-antitoxin stability system